jgi:hypothetical protein
MWGETLRSTDLNTVRQQRPDIGSRDKPVHAGIMGDPFDLIKKKRCDIAAGD